VLFSSAVLDTWLKCGVQFAVLYALFDTWLMCVGWLGTTEPIPHVCGVAHVVHGELDVACGMWLACLGLWSVFAVARIWPHVVKDRLLPHSSIGVAERALRLSIHCAFLQILGCLVLVVANSTMEPFLHWMTFHSASPLVFTAVMAAVLFMVRECVHPRSPLLCAQHFYVCSPLVCTLPTVHSGIGSCH
jgi:hypothetical protein